MLLHQHLLTCKSSFQSCFAFTNKPNRLVIAVCEQRASTGGTISSNRRGMERYNYLQGWTKAKVSDECGAVGYCIPVRSADANLATYRRPDRRLAPTKDLPSRHMQPVTHTNTHRPNPPPTYRRTMSP